MSPRSSPPSRNQRSFVDLPLLIGLCLLITAVLLGMTRCT
jgi:hypothetical protein